MTHRKLTFQNSHLSRTHMEACSLCAGRMYMYMSVCVWYMCAFTYVCMNLYAYIYVYMYRYTCMYMWNVMYFIYVWNVMYMYVWNVMYFTHIQSNSVLQKRFDSKIPKSKIPIFSQLNFPSATKTWPMTYRRRLSDSKFRKAKSREQKTKGYF